MVLTMIIFYSSEEIWTFWRFDDTSLLMICAINSIIG